MKCPYCNNEVFELKNTPIYPLQLFKHQSKKWKEEAIEYCKKIGFIRNM